MTAYRGDYDKTKYMSFLIKNEELLEKHNKIWDKVSNSMKKGFDSKPVYSEKHIKTKTISNERKISINFILNDIKV